MDLLVELRKQTLANFKGFQSSRFFEPNDQMVKSIIDFADGRFIIDIGCGDGHFIEMLFKNGYKKALGFDCYSDGIVSGQRIMKSTGSLPQILPYEVNDPFTIKFLENFKHKSIVTLCRPCHSEDLIGGTIEACKKFGIPLLYIGLERNIEEDLYDVDYKVLNLKGKAKDGEKIYFI